MKANWTGFKADDVTPSVFVEFQIHQGRGFMTADSGIELIKMNKTTKRQLRSIEAFWSVEYEAVGKSGVALQLIIIIDELVKLKW